jgi:hypothetical protein
VPFIPSTGVWKVVMEGGLAARTRWASILHVSSEGAALTQAEADNIAGIIGDAWEDSGILGYLSTGWTLEKYTVTDLTSESAPQFVSVAGVQNGSDGGQVLPGQTAGMIEWTTGLRGRSFRGRSFFCGFTETASDGLPLAAVVTALTTWATGLIGDLNTASRQLGILSQFHGTELVTLPDNQRVKRPTPRDHGLFTAIIEGQGETVWKTQRRRAFPG